MDYRISKPDKADVDVDTLASSVDIRVTIKSQRQPAAESESAIVGLILIAQILIMHCYVSQIAHAGERASDLW